MLPISKESVLVLEGDDAKEFWEDMRNPKVTKEQIQMFKDAKRIYETQFKWRLRKRWN